jgi:hypothetical protein
MYVRPNVDVIMIQRKRVQRGKKTVADEGNNREKVLRGLGGSVWQKPMGKIGAGGKRCRWNAVPYAVLRGNSEAKQNFCTSFAI